MPTLRRSASVTIYGSSRFSVPCWGGDFRPDSDVDVLVEFEEGHTPGLFTFAGMEIEISELIGRKVDLRTPQELSRYFREEVVAAAQVEYVKG